MARWHFRGGCALGLPVRRRRLSRGASRGICAWDVRRRRGAAGCPGAAGGVVLPGEIVSAGRVGQRLANVNLQVRGDGQHSGVEGHVVAGAGGQAVPRVQALDGRTVLPRLDVSGQQHPAGHPRGWVQAAKDTPAAAVGRHIQRECVLSDAGRSQDDPFGILRWPLTLGGATGNLVPQGALEYRRVRFVLAEEGKLAAVLEVEEIGQARQTGSALVERLDGTSARTSGRNSRFIRVSEVTPVRRISRSSRWSGRREHGWRLPRARPCAARPPAP